MKKLFWQVLILCFNAGLHAQPQYQLAPPLLKYKSVFFTDTATTSLHFAMEGTKIHYTTNGSNPAENSAEYKGPILISKNLTTIKANVSGAPYLSSSVISKTFIKNGLKVKSVHHTKPHNRFTGNGPYTLIDNNGGITDINSNTWLGYQGGVVEIVLDLGKEIEVTSVLLNFLQDHNAWVFLPEQISIWNYKAKNKKYALWYNEHLENGEQATGGGALHKLLTPAKKVKTNKVKIVLQALSAMPPQHPGEGKPAWLFIDEIKVY